MNFKEELLKELNTSKDTVCLISKDTLEENCITLSCGHSFNYVPLYNEIIFQKRYVNNLEINKLLYNQIKCPYCREISNKLIPYQERDGVYKLYGVNSPDKYAMPIYKCEWVYKSGKKKGRVCNSVAGLYNHGCYCSKHLDTSHQCCKILKNGNQCKNKVKISGTLCYRHK
tara:strand:+ start:16321 stop:16833 length:513 start_codon:yes stop_codon:yes gene_type:complete